MNGYTFYYMDGRRVFTHAEDIEQAYKNIGFVPKVDHFIAWYDSGLTNSHWFDDKYKCWNKKQILTIDRITQSKLSSDDIRDMMSRCSCVRYTLPNGTDVAFYELAGQGQGGYVHGWCLTSVEPKTQRENFGSPNQYWPFADLINACCAFKMRCCGSNSLSIKSYTIENLLISL